MAALSSAIATNVVVSPAVEKFAPRLSARSSATPVLNGATTFCSPITASPTASHAVRMTTQASSSDAAAEGSQTYHYCIANAKFMLDDEEHFQEQLKERLRWLQEKGEPQNFWLVYEPAFLNELPDVAKRVQRPAVALVSTDGIWITFMKLRLDRVLRGEYTAASVDEALASQPVSAEFPPPANWIAPYPKYEAGWWTPYLPPALATAKA